MAAREIALDARLEAALGEQGCEVQSFNASLLAEPWQVDPIGRSVQGLHPVLAGLARAGRIAPAPARAA